MTARACAPEPACDDWISIVSPVLAFQSAMKAGLIALYSSRVGS